MKDVLDYLHNVLVTSSKDWGQDRADAILYGVLVGWDDDEGDAMPELAAQHGWSATTVARIRELNRIVEASR